MTDAVDIRRGRATDAAAIAALVREAYGKWVPVIGREPKPMTVDYADTLTRHRFDLLFAGQALAALIETVPRGDELLIENVAVRPAFQRQGHGVRLLRRAETLAETAGLAGTRLYTNQRFAENLRLYASLGYLVAREEATATGIAVHLVKRRALPPEAPPPPR